MRVVYVECMNILWCIVAFEREFVSVSWFGTQKTKRKGKKILKIENFNSQKISHEHVVLLVLRKAKLISYSHKG